MATFLCGARTGFEDIGTPVLTKLLDELCNAALFGMIQVQLILHMGTQVVDLIEMYAQSLVITCSNSVGLISKKAGNGVVAQTSGILGSKRLGKWKEMSGLHSRERL
jgi:hypothetical protein